MYAQRSIEGLSGTVKMDRNGKRSTFNLDLITLASDGFEKVSLTQISALITYRPTLSAVLLQA